MRNEEVIADVGYFDKCRSEPGLLDCSLIIHTLQVLDIRLGLYMRPFTLAYRRGCIISGQK